MPDILLLRLEAPLQAWGERARWDVRDTAREPTRSGVIGLLGCALGYSRHDARLVDILHERLEIGIRVEREGTILADYHTVTDFLPTAEGGYRFSGGTSMKLPSPEDAKKQPATIVSVRRYLQDASFLVAIAPRDLAYPEVIAMCANAVQAPHWPLFLGRKCCVPTRPVFDAVVSEYADVQDALTRHPLMHRTKRIRLVLEGPGPHGFSERDDVPTLSPSRMYRRSRVHETILDLDQEAT